jgi:hypothetical protein
LRFYPSILYFHDMAIKLDEFRQALEGVDLQWFAEGQAAGVAEKANGVAGDGEAPGDGASGGQKAGNGAGDGEGTVSKSDYIKLQNDLAAMKKAAEKREAAEKKKAEDALKEQGKYKELYETSNGELVSLRDRVAKAEQVVGDMLTAELSDLPESFDKSLIPDIPVPDKLSWLRRYKASIEKIAPKAAARTGDGSPAPKGQAGEAGAMTPAERLAERYRKTRTYG